MVCRQELDRPVSQWTWSGGNKSIKQDTQILKSDLKNKKVNISSKGYKLLYKLYDRCNLAIIQRNAYKETKESIQRNVNDFFEEKYSEESDRNIKPKMDSLEKDITTQLISLVSIFTALAFVMFGSSGRRLSCSAHRSPPSAPAP